MSSASTSIQPIDDDTDNNNDQNTNNVSSSHFRTTVVLQDWWLVKADTEFEGKRLAVAGLGSREKQALRVFCSAPIFRRFDVFTLETVDGILVVLKGFINKVRTIENGFPSEVFKHFLFGFPPFWEDYAEKCFAEMLGSDKSTHSVIEVADSKDSSKETSNIKDGKTSSEERHDNSEKLHLGLKDSGDMLSAEEPHSLKASVCNESSIQVLKDHSQVSSAMIVGDVSKGSNSQIHTAKHNVDVGSGVSNKGIKVTLGVNSSIPENEGHTTFTADVVNNDDHGVSNDTLKNPHLPTDSAKNNATSVGTDMVLPQEPSDHCMTRSCKNMDKIKVGEGKIKTQSPSKCSGAQNLNILSGNGNIDAASTESCLPEANGMDNTSPSKFNEAVSVDASVMNLKLFSKDCDSSRKDIKENKKGKLKNSRKELKDFSTVPLSHPEVVVKFADENPNSSGGTPNESLPTAPVVENPRVLEMSETCLAATTGKATNTRASKLKNVRGHQENSPALKCDLEYQNSECNYVSVACENPVEETSNKSSPITTPKSLEKFFSQIEDGMSNCGLSYSKRKLKDNQTAISGLGNDRNKLNSVSVGHFNQLKNAESKIDCESGGRSILNLPDGESQERVNDSTVRNVFAECVNNGSDQKCMFSPGGTSPKQEQILGTRTKSKNSNKSVRSSLKLGDANHKVNLNISLGKKESKAKEASTHRKKTPRKLTYGSPSTGGVEEKPSIVSSQSFKRSRSGRLLLPTLEFWRNQTAIYDSDRRISGIQDGLPVLEPSRGSRSEPQRKRKQLA